MTRIPDEDLARLKSDIDLKSLVERSGIDLTPHGKDWIGHCPFHDDKTPSLVISPDKNLWHCLGACGEGGDVIHWVMKREGISFRAAVEKLQIMDGGLRATSKVLSPLAANAVKSIDSVLIEHQDLLQQVVAIYHEHLLNDDTAMDYLTSRGLDSVELIKQFKLGVAHGDLSRHFPSRRVPRVVS